jgi:putative lipase involved disintegration of autophagic bodies
VGIPCGNPGYTFRRGVLHNLRGQQSRCTDGHDLIIVAMKDEGWHIELLQSSVKSVSEKALMQS